MLDVNATTHQGEAVRVSVDELPDHCPLCHQGIEAIYQKLAHLLEPFCENLELVFRCPRQKCQSFFIARYYKVGFTGSSYFAYKCSVPFEPFDSAFSERITKISPDFCEIANQARKAQDQGWKLVAGPGYRKALEFLIKDYLCRLRPNEAKEIKSAELGRCIANYVANDRIKATAVRAAWLGNDETHYLRKWEDKDLDDLKKLIGLTVRWIEMEEMTDSVIKDMPEGKK